MAGMLLNAGKLEDEILKAWSRHIPMRVLIGTNESNKTTVHGILVGDQQV